MDCGEQANETPDSGLGLGQGQEGDCPEGVARSHRARVPRARRFACVHGPWVVFRLGQEPVGEIIPPGILPWWAEEPRGG